MGEENPFFALKDVSNEKELLSIGTEENHEPIQSSDLAGVDIVSNHEKLCENNEMLPTTPSTESEKSSQFEDEGEATGTESTYSVTQESSNYDVIDISSLNKEDEISLDLNTTESVVNNNEDSQEIKQETKKLSGELDVIRFSGVFKALDGILFEYDTVEDKHQIEEVKNMNSNEENLSFSEINEASKTEIISIKNKPKCVSAFKKLLDPKFKEELTELKELKGIKKLIQDFENAKEKENISVKSSEPVQISKVDIQKLKQNFERKTVTNAELNEAVVLYQRERDELHKFESSTSTNVGTLNSKENKCMDNTCLDNTCLDNTGLDNSCEDNTCLDNTGVDNTSIDNNDLDNTCLDNNSLDNTRLVNTSLENTCLDNSRSDNTCLDNPSDYVSCTSLMSTDSYYSTNEEITLNETLDPNSTVNADFTYTSNDGDNFSWNY